MARYKADRGSGRCEVLRGFELHGQTVKSGTYVTTDELGDLLLHLISRGAIRVEGVPPVGGVAPTEIQEMLAEPEWAPPTAWSTEEVESV
ncbi:MAG: hypothetical protein IPH08_04215 [Rhodocyclaceae bacterium]|nr:hypothetical protein [Rhodocyclaceae bacterium]